MNLLRRLMRRRPERDVDDMKVNRELHDQKAEHDQTMARVRGLLSPENRRVVDAVTATADGIRQAGGRADR